MAKIKIDIDMHESSLDNSGDGELLGMVDEGSFGSTEDRTQLVSEALLGDEEENTGSYSVRNYCGLANLPTYKLVQMANDHTANSITSKSPTHVLSGGEYYVIGNPVEVFGTPPQQKKAIPRDPLEVKPTVHGKKRDDKRRATHNEVERRRRDKINSWITKLAALVPNTGLPDSASKGGILAKACDYIFELTEKQKRFEELEVDNNKLVLEIIRLNQEVTELRKENNSLRNENRVVLSHRPKGQKS